MSFKVYKDSKNLLVISNGKSAWWQDGRDSLQDTFMEATNNGWDIKYAKYTSLKFIATVNSYEEFAERYPEYLI